MKGDSNQTNFVGSVREVFSVGSELAVVISNVEVEVDQGGR